jgi:peptide/nickel transport system substrate-binding protein
VRRDPAHFHYFYAANTPPNGLFFNDQQYPYSLVGFRKAISYAIDRNKLYTIGEYGYEPPTDAIGIAGEYPSWVDKGLESQAKALATYDPNKAKAMLAQSHFTWKGGQLYDPKGHKVSIQLGVISGWTDWVLDCQILQKNLQAIGIATTVKTMDNNSWNDKADKGQLSAHLHWVNSGTTPYNLFYGYMSKESYVPTGQDASLNGQTNWERWYSPEATKLLTLFRQTTDLGTQHAIVNMLQKIQLDQMPYIPLVYGAIWYTYSTKNFGNWVAQNNYYAIGAPYQYPDNVKVMTSITPAK